MSELNKKLKELKLAQELPNDNTGEYSQGYVKAINDVLNHLNNTNVIDGKTNHNASDSNSDLDGIISESDFYCDETGKNGYTCEDGQCDRCKRMERTAACLNCNREYTIKPNDSLECDCGTTVYGQVET